MKAISDSCLSDKEFVWWLNKTTVMSVLSCKENTSEHGVFCLPSISCTCLIPNSTWPFSKQICSAQVCLLSKCLKHVAFWMIWMARTSELTLTEQFAWLTNSVLNVYLKVTVLSSTNHIDIFRCGLGNKRLLEMLSPSSVHTAKRKFLAFLGVLLSKWLWHRVPALNQDQTLKRATTN